MPQPCRSSRLPAAAACSASSAASLGGAAAGSAVSGGLGSLLEQFRNAGLGQQANSWVGTGQNHPITPEQINSVIGQGKIAEIAQQAGLEPGANVAVARAGAADAGGQADARRPAASKAEALSSVMAAEPQTALAIPQGERPWGANAIPPPPGQPRGVAGHCVHFDIDPVARLAPAPDWSRPACAG